MEPLATTLSLLNTTPWIHGIWIVVLVTLSTIAVWYILNQKKQTKQQQQKSEQQLRVLSSKNQKIISQQQHYMQSWQQQAQQFKHLKQSVKILAPHINALNILSLNARLESARHAKNKELQTIASELESVAQNLLNTYKECEKPPLQNQEKST